MQDNQLKTHLKPIIDLAILEDIGDGDITTEAILKDHRLAKGQIISKSKSILCGLPIVDYVFNYNSDDIKNSKFFFSEGTLVNNGDVVYEVTGSVTRLLSYERIALNLLQRLSGIASKTREFVDALEGKSKPKILDTRKTIPGYRALEKYAVHTGGATNHRMGLYDLFMIKDNHISIAGSVGNAIKLVRQYKRDKEHLKPLKIEVECKSLDQVKQAIDQSVDIIMLDNMPDSAIRQAVHLIPSGIQTEVSGNITVGKVPTLSRLNIDFISCGAITHSSVSRDFSMAIDLI